MVLKVMVAADQAEERPKLQRLGALSAKALDVMIRKFF